MNRSLSCALASVLACVLAAGCQGYQAMPLDAAHHKQEWQKRSASAEAVAVYAQRLAASGADRAEGFDPSDGLTLREAEVVALYFNPELRKRRLEAAVPLAGSGHAGTWNGLDLSTDGEAILESVSDPWVIGGTLSITIPLSGRLGAEKDLTLARHDMAIWRARVAENELLLLLREAWVQHAVLREQAELAAGYAEELRSVQAVAVRLADAGESRMVDARLFDIEVARWRGQSARAKRYVHGQELATRRLLGLMPDAPLKIETSFDCGLPELTAAERRERLMAGMHLGEADAAHIVAERAVRLEIQKQYPDLTLGVGYANGEGQSRITFGFGIPIPTFNLNRQGIAEARAHRLLTKATWEATIEELTHRVTRAEADLAAIREHLTHLLDELAPLIDQQVTDARRLAELGQFDAVLLKDALEQRHELVLAVLDARHTESTLSINLHSLAGRVWAPAAEEEINQ